MKRRHLAAAVAALAILVSANAQQRAATPASFDVSVSRVEVDVVVLDKRGDAVPGLKPEDFEVYEDGQRVEIVDFELRSFVAEAPANALPPAPLVTAATETPPEPRRFILFADLLNSSVRGIKHAKGDLLDFLDKVMRPDDEMMIGILAPDSRVLVLQSFTSSREALRPRIAALQGNPKLDLFRQRQEEAIRSALEAPEAENLVKDIVRAAASDQFDRASFSLNALASFVELVEKRGWQTGRKTVLYLAEGEGMLAGQEWFEILNKSVPSVSGEQSDYNLQPLLRKTVSRLNLARATLYSLSTRGTFKSLSSGAASFGPGILSPGEEMMSFFASQDSLNTLAVDTGGIAYINRSNWDGALREVERDNRLVYYLTYSPPSRQGKPPEFHQIEVKCRRPDVRVRARKGYIDS